MNLTDAERASLRGCLMWLLVVMAFCGGFFVGAWTGKVTP